MLRDFDIAFERKSGLTCLLVGWVQLKLPCRFAWRHRSLAYKFLSAHTRTFRCHQSHPGENFQVHTPKAAIVLALVVGEDSSISSSVHLIHRLPHSQLFFSGDWFIEHRESQSTLMMIPFILSISILTCLLPTAGLATEPFLPLQPPQ